MDSGIRLILSLFQLRFLVKDRVVMPVGGIPYAITVENKYRRCSKYCHKVLRMYQEANGRARGVLTGRGDERWRCSWLISPADPKCSLSEAAS